MPDIRTRGVRALGRLGWLARDALPLLVSLLNDPDATVREASAQAVGQMGPEALPHLTTMLLHPDKYVRRNAVWAMGKLGPLAKSAIPDLCATLRDTDPRTASGAAQALGNMGADAVDAIPALTEAMRGTNIVLCRLAAKALSQIGRPALPALIAHLRHRDPFVRGEAALALGWMGSAAAAAVPGLIEALHKSSPSPYPTSGISEEENTPSTPITPPQPGQAADEASRGYIIQALGRIGPSATAAIDLLTQHITDPNEQISQFARQSIRQIQQG